MEHEEVVILRLFDCFGDVVVVRRGVEQPGARDHPGGVGQPGRIPERPHFPRRLVTRPRPPVEVIVGGRVKEERLHHVHAANNSANPSAWLVVEYYKPELLKQDCRMSGYWILQR